MVEELGVQDGDRLLEIGTGTGYQAALLCHRVGADRVTSVDIDPALTESAIENLRAVGYEPSVKTGDGAIGVPDAAPYDRVIATCSFSSVPTAWLDQTRPDGVILTNLYQTLVGGPIVRLTVTGPRTAQGHLLAEAGTYMPSRFTAAVDVDELLRTADQAPAGQTHHTDITFDPRIPAGWHVLAGFALPGVVPVDIDSPASGRAMWLLHPDGSWAFHNMTTMAVEQGGPRSLWSALEEAHQRWVADDRPSRERYGLTVTSDGVRLWLDEPRGPGRVEFGVTR